jgi:uncharacterized membrane protein YvlD (DUF360 family)
MLWLVLEEVMALVPLSDFSLAQFLMVSILYGSVAYLVVMLVEAVALWVLHWDSFTRSLRDSSIANLITTFLGFLPILFMPPWLYDMGFPLGIFVLCTLSILIEGVVLYIISKNSFGKTFRTSSMINICSYVLIYFFHPLIQ